jgi:hypothetical protein
MARNEFQIKVETTCGKTFVEDVRDLPTEVLRVLLKDNEGNERVEPHELAAVLNQLETRRASVNVTDEMSNLGRVKKMKLDHSAWPEHIRKNIHTGKEYFDK